MERVKHSYNLPINLPSVTSYATFSAARRSTAAEVAKYFCVQGSVIFKICYKLCPLCLCAYCMYCSGFDSSYIIDFRYDMNHKWISLS